MISGPEKQKGSEGESLPWEVEVESGANRPT